MILTHATNLALTITTALAATNHSLPLPTPPPPNHPPHNHHSPRNPYLRTATYTTTLPSNETHTFALEESLPHTTCNPFTLTADGKAYQIFAPTCTPRSGTSWVTHCAISTQCGAHAAAARALAWEFSGLEPAVKDGLAKGAGRVQDENCFYSGGACWSRVPGATAGGYWVGGGRRVGWWDAAVVGAGAATRTGGEGAAGVGRWKGEGDEVVGTWKGMGPKTKGVVKWG